MIAPPVMRRAAASASALLLVLACGPAAAGSAAADAAAAARPARLPGFGPRVFGDHPTVAQMTDLGRKIFFDRGLSRSGRLACASCHDPAHAYGPPDGRAVQTGGPAMDRRGMRAVPSLRYLAGTIPFTGHFIDDEDGHGEDGGPTGALTWDGRVDTPHEQAAIPLFAGHEFANRSPAELAARVRRSSYAAAFEAAFSGPGEKVFDDPARVLAWVGMALEVFQQSPDEFYPYSSKFDAYLRGETRLSGLEQRGLALFEDPAKGNCARCHPSRRASDGSPPRFTDSAYAALGVPRNRSLAQGAGASRNDLGLCGNGRAETAGHEDYCGLFKTPTLRNVATRRVFFHNGRIHSLQAAVEFYATRDSDPRRWYPVDARGRVRKFDDLPERYHPNVDAAPPFGNPPGAGPRLDAAEVRAVVAFLKTLDDGWSAPKLTRR